MLLRLLLALVFATVITVAAHARTLIGVLSPDYAGPRDELVQLFATEATELKPADQMILYDARTRRQIATIRPSTDPKASNRAWALKQIAAQFAPVRQWIEAMPPTPPTGEIAGNLYLPDVLAEIGRNVLPTLPDKKADIVLIGSRIYWDKRDGRFAMTDRRYPSDAHLRGNPADTPFSTFGRETLLAGATIHLCSPRNDFVSKDHEEATARWWSLYIVAQGGRVGTLGFDIPTCFRRARAGEFSGQATYTSTGGTKLEMLRAHSAIPAVVPASLERPGEYFLHDNAPISRIPPSTTMGVAWIGIRWMAPADLDLIARGDSSKPFVFFGNTQSAEAWFSKDWRSAPGETQYEYIEFLTPIDLAQAEVLINLYDGQVATGPEGVIRLWFQGRIYEAPFKIAATVGNKGAPPVTGPNWVRIDLRRVAGLPTTK